MSSFDQPNSNGEDRSLVPVFRRPPDHALAMAPEGLAYAGPGSAAGTAHLIRRILQYKRTILVVALAVAVPLWAVVWLSMGTKYKAEGQIEVRPVIQPLVYDLGRGDSRSVPFYHEFVFTQVAVIRGATVLERVLDSNEVKATRWYRRERDRGREPSLTNLRDRILTVQTAGRTHLISVSARMDRPEDAVALVRTVLDKYIAYVRQSEDEDSATMYKQLVLEHDNLQATIHDAEKRIDWLRAELGTGDPEDLVAQQRKRVDEMQARMDELDRTIKLAEFDVNQLRASLGLPDLSQMPLPEHSGDAAAGATSQPALAHGDPSLFYAEDLQWRAYDIEAKNLKQDLMIRGRTLGPGHPDIRELQDRVRLAEANLETRRTQLDRQLAGVGGGGGPVMTGASLTGTASLSRDLQVKQETLRRLAFERTLLQDHLDKQGQASTASFGRAQTLRTQLRDLTAKQELFEKVRATLERRRMERHLPGSIQILAYPYMPDRPEPNRRAVVSFGVLLLGLVSGVGVAFLRVKVNPNIQEAQELTDSSAVPFLGQLPLIRPRERQSLLDNPLLNEGIRMVRTPLLQRIDQSIQAPGGRGRGHVVLITSAGAGDGKTTVSVLLARSLANCGRRVLLVDADLRNPSLASVLRLDNQRGLMDVLIGPEDHDGYIVGTDVERLSVLPTGNVAGRADPELITDGRFSAAIARWRLAFDVVLMDSPPVLPVADARILARHADGALLVVRAYQNQREDVLEAVRHIESAGGQIWGTVFVGADRHYGYSSRYGYSYGYGAKA